MGRKQDELEDTPCPESTRPSLFGQTRAQAEKAKRIRKIPRLGRSKVSYSQAMGAKAKSQQRTNSTRLPHAVRSYSQSNGPKAKPERPSSTVLTPSRSSS